MKIEKATPADLDAIMYIVAQAQASLGALGIDQWQDGYPSRDIISGDIERGVGYVVRAEVGTEADDEVGAEAGDEVSAVVATAHISFDGEVTYEKIFGGEWLSDGPYAVIHRIAVADSARKLGVAGFIVESVCERCKKMGLTSIKIDTHEGNSPMRAFLTKSGFKQCGTIYLTNGDSRIAYELIV
jgi:Predicted acyltransferase